MTCSGPEPRGRARVDRRRFIIKACAAVLGVLRSSGDVRAADAHPVVYHPYQQARLTTKTGRPLEASRLVRHENYVFFYPYAGTPCLLLDLGQEVRGLEVKGPSPSDAYRWPGGVGPRRSVVAYTAICSHLWSHPTKDATVISYYGPKDPSELCGAGSRITCCAHGSCFDPAAGGTVLRGPAEFPLATVSLKWDERTDELVAQGIWGRDRFGEFFTSFPAESREEVSGQAPVVFLRDYASFVARC